MSKDDNKNLISNTCNSFGLLMIEEYTSSRKSIEVRCEKHKVNTIMTGDQAVKLSRENRNLCNVCRKIDTPNNSIVLTDDQYIAYAIHQQNNQYTYSLPLAKDSDGKITVICPKHGEFKIRKSAHVSPKQLYGCQKCKQSKGELAVSKFLDEHNIKYTIEKQFNGLVGNNGITPLRYDFYLPDYNLIIEYDGVHHYHPKKFGSRQTSNDMHMYKRRVKFYDTIKNAYALIENINMIRISYTDYNDIDKILAKELEI